MPSPIRQSVCREWRCTMRPRPATVMGSLTHSLPMHSQVAFRFASWQIARPSRHRHNARSAPAETPMHNFSIPQSIIDRVIAKRGREHVFESIEPTKTALIVVDRQNAFMLPGVAHALCPMAEKVVPNINRLAAATRATGGQVIWIQT